MSAVTSSIPAMLPTVGSIFSALTDRFKLSPRASQLELGGLTRDALGSGGVCCVEAPTGTGKTLGYLAGALDAMAHAGTELPIVVATATVGLQEQIIRHDIPRLAAVGAIDPRHVAVAKGRGRYFCPRTTTVLEDKKHQDTQLDMLNPEKPVALAGAPIALDMLHAWRDGTWDGDRDSWPGKIPECWDATCGAKTETCVNRACEHFDRCPYMGSRQKLSQAKLVVANHDIVLADLAQRADEQQTSALPFKRYALVFDEAHNLPEKAIAMQQACAKLSDTAWLLGLEPYSASILSIGSVNKTLSRSTDFPVSIFTSGAATLAHGMSDYAKEIQEQTKFSSNGTSSWGLTTPDDHTIKRVVGLAKIALQLKLGFQAAAKALADYIETASGLEKAHGIRRLATTHQYLRYATDLHEGLYLFCTSERLVRWLSRDKHGHISLHAQPMEGKDVLNALLWCTDFPVALVSATLQVEGSFERFRDKTGLPAHAVTRALPPVFDYSRGYLHLPAMVCAPGEAGYELELTDKLEKLYAQSAAKGFLVLFTSRESMRRVISALSSDTRSATLVQGSQPIPELVQLHKARIDAGGRSILVGLDSMAEGLDLPGHYCSHVVITRLPFAVPGDPVEEARQAALGPRWFEHAYMADMLTMFIQAAGRLIRREEDHGVITLLDKRVGTKRYGARALAALPGFSRGPRLKGYFELAAARGFEMSPQHKPKAAPKLQVISGGVSPASSSVEKAAAAQKPAAQGRGDGPVQALARLIAQPAVVHSAVPCTVETLHNCVARLAPFDKGPFPDDEPEYLMAGLPGPVLAPGTSAGTFAERQLPEATILGLLLKNLDWDGAAPAWRQVLALRPDLMQFATVLRSYREGWEDARKAVLTEEQCALQLERGLAGLKCPGLSDAIIAVGQMEAAAVSVLAENFSLPSRELLAEMASAALAMATEFRARR